MACRPLSLPLLALLILFAGCELQLNLVAEGRLVVGQEVLLKVTEGGDGSEPRAESLWLQDLAGRRFESAELSVAKPRPGELAFRIPAGIAPGRVTLDVKTEKGPAFRGGLLVGRLLAARDGTGNVLLPLLEGEGQASPLAELRDQQAGFGAGVLAISPGGGVLAVAARPDQEVRLVRLGASPRVTPPVVLPDIPRDLLIGEAGEVLVAGERGISVLQKPASFSTAPALLDPPLLNADTVALARDDKGQQGVALIRSGTPALYGLVRIDLAASPVVAAAPVPLSWPADPPYEVDVAIGEGGVVVAVNKARNVLATLAATASSAQEHPMPEGQSGPVAIAAATGGLFLIANGLSRNLTLLRVKADLPVFDPPLDPGLPAESGSPLAVAASRRDDFLMLFERDLFLWHGAGRTGVKLSLPALFADKVKGPSPSLVVQP